jgi:hypothetical protein
MKKICKHSFIEDASGKFSICQLCGKYLDSEEEVIAHEAEKTGEANALAEARAEYDADNIAEAEAENAWLAQQGEEGQ